MVGAGLLAVLFGATAAVAGAAPGSSKAPAATTTGGKAIGSSRPASLAVPGRDAAAEQATMVPVHSVTFVSPDDGWTLAGTACRQGICPAVYHTADRGGHWRRLADLPQSALGIDKPYGVRFADPMNGWVFGEALLATHDGGAHWDEVSTAGPVVALETSQRLAYAVIDPCIHTTECHKPETLIRSDVAADRWETATTLPSRAGIDAELAVRGDAVYVLPTDSELVASADGSQYATSSVPCQPDGGSRVSAAALAAASPADVTIVCVGGAAAGTQQKAVYASTDGARTFRRIGDPPLSGDTYQLSTPVPATTVIAASSGASDLYRTSDGGRKWSDVVHFGDGGVGWTDLGFVDAHHGAVVYGGDWAFANDRRPAGAPQPGTVYLSDDDGATWRPSTLPPDSGAPAAGRRSPSNQSRLLDAVRVSATAGWVLTPTGMLRTDDGGASWRLTPIPEIENPFPSTFVVLGSSAWSVSMSKEGPITVTRVNADGAVLTGHIPRPAAAYPSVSASFASPKDGWAAVLKPGPDREPGRSDIWSTRDGGATWTEVAADTALAGTLQLAGGHLVGLGKTFQTTADGGRTWRTVDVPVPFDASLAGGFDHLAVFGRHEILPAGADTGLRGRQWAVVSDDTGGTWTVRDIPGDRANDGPALRFVATSAAHWIATQQTEVWTTDDAGGHWKQLTGTAGPGSVETLSFAGAVHGWAIASRGCGDIACPPDGGPAASLYASDDGGTSWARVSLPSG
ncbi:MAG: hypothetical protein QOJ23_3041 [Actinomycetota bacterium]|nr:hypothetical protein [Actinomycetota bacterium]